MIPSREIQLFIIEPPGRIYMHSAYTVFIISFAIEQMRKITAHICSRGIMQITAYGIAAIGQTVRMTAGFGIQQKSRTLTGAGSKDHGPAAYLVFLQIVFTHIRNTGSESFLIREHLAGHGISDQIDI